MHERRGKRRAGRRPNKKNNRKNMREKGKSSCRKKEEALVEKTSQQSQKDILRRSSILEGCWRRGGSRKKKNKGRLVALRMGRESSTRKIRPRVQDGDKMQHLRVGKGKKQEKIMMKSPFAKQ